MQDALYALYDIKFIRLSTKSILSLDPYFIPNITIMSAKPVIPNPIALIFL